MMSNNKINKKFLVLKPKKIREKEREKGRSLYSVYTQRKFFIKNYYVWHSYGPLLEL